MENEHVGAVEKARAFYDEVYREGHASNYGGDDAAFDERIKALGSCLVRWMQRCDVKSDDKVLEVGCGLGYLQNIHPAWHGIEYSVSAVRRARAMDPSMNIETGDARNLPISDGAIDFLFTFAALEHVPDVERAFLEIDRVLTKGGVALIAPAWNCRSWTVKKLQLRPYSELGLPDRVSKALIPVRENLVFRAAWSLIPRIFREGRLLLGGPLKLDYRKLEPDFSLNESYPHITDDDAFVSIDAHAALTWFAARRYELISHSGIIRRMMIRGEEIVVRKSMQ